jgi:tetratricopeptide (TPR) repeat protein
LNAGELDAAASVCSALTRTHPDDPAVLQLAATIALRNGNPQESLTTIRRSLIARPGHVPSLMLAANAAIAAGLGHEAAGLAREAATRAPENSDATFLLCRTLIGVSDNALGLAIARAAVRHPNDAAQWQRLGLELQRVGRQSAALDAFTRAVAADPSLGPAHFGRGLLLRDADRMEESRHALELAVTLDPTASGAWFALGLTCQDLHDEAAAAEAFQAALHHRSAFAEAAVNLGIARQRLGDMNRALEAYREAVHIRPDTFGRIAQAVTAARTGMLCLDPGAFRRLLHA